MKMLEQIQKKKKTSEGSQMVLIHPMDLTIKKKTTDFRTVLLAAEGLLSSSFTPPKREPGLLCQLLWI